MPVIFNEPRERPDVIGEEITYFAGLLTDKVAIIRYTEIDAQGALLESRDVRVALFDAEGNPRYTEAEYQDIKALLNRLALEDGHISGQVV